MVEKLIRPKATVFTNKYLAEKVRLSAEQGDNELISLFSQRILRFLTKVGYIGKSFPTKIRLNDRIEM